MIDCCRPYACRPFDKAEIHLYRVHFLLKCGVDERNECNQIVFFFFVIE